MPAPFTLFRVDKTRTTEKIIRADKPYHQLNSIDFDFVDSDPRVPSDIPGPDRHTKLIGFNPMVGRFRSRNPAPFSDATVKQDVGFEGIRFNLTMLFNEQGLPNGASAGGRSSLLRWSIERATIRGDFPHGTVGMRNDWSPEFNITPSSTAGLKITSYQYQQEIGMPYLTRGEITLEFSGDPNTVWFT